MVWESVDLNASWPLDKKKINKQIDFFLTLFFFIMQFLKKKFLHLHLFYILISNVLFSSPYIHI